MVLATRKELLDRLTNNVVDLYFEKADGSKRRMRATLLSSEIPGGSDESSDQYAGPQESGKITVYDLDKKDWRSFLIERVSTVITPSLGETLTTGKDHLV